MYIHKIYSYSQDYSEIILIQQKLIPAKKKDTDATYETGN